MNSLNVPGAGIFSLSFVILQPVLFRFLGWKWIWRGRDDGGGNDFDENDRTVDERYGRFDYRFILFYYVSDDSDDNDDTDRRISVNGSTDINK